MTEIILLVVIVFLLGFLVWREREHDLHIRELENKIKSPVVQKIIKEPLVKREKPEENQITNDNPNEIMLGEIPFMEIPKEFKIEYEGSPETPAEARARAEK
jgi:hypothetical protein